MRSELKQPYIARALKKLPGWKYYARKRAIGIDLKLKDFMAAVRLINQIAKIAETHTVGRVTTKDFKLAAQIQRLIQ
jgi:pterin-4a-carbinolamine dehydratase